MFHHTFNKGITIHGTNNTILSSNVVYETIGHSYFFENGSETGNALIGNLGINTRASDSRETATISSDFSSPSTFWVENIDNILIGNHTAGSEDSGFWFEAQGQGGGATMFHENTSHSNKGRGFKLNHGGLIQDRNPEGSPAAPQKVKPWVVDRFTTYKSLGVYIRGIEGEFTNSAFAELDSNARFRLNQTIRDSLIVGRTKNIGTPTTRDEVAAGRSLPDGGNTFEGFQLYDGPGGLSSVHFDGFRGDDDAIKDSNAIHKSASFFLKDITWGPNVDEAAKFDIGGGGNAIGNDAWARGLIDIDGSVTGAPGAMIYARSSDRDGARTFNAGERTEERADWGAMITYDRQSATLRIDDNGTAESNHGGNAGNPMNDLAITRSDGEYATDVSDQIPLFDGYTYALDYDALDQDTFRLYLHDADWGQSFILDLGPTPAGSRFTVDDPYSDTARPAREVSSLAMLERSPDTAVFRGDDGTVRIKLVAEMAHGYLWPQPGETMADGLHSGVTVLVDTGANVNLERLTYNDPSSGETLGEPPYKEEPPRTKMRLHLVDAATGMRLQEIRGRNTVIERYDLSSGDYAFEVEPRGSGRVDVQSIRSGVRGGGANTDNYSPYTPQPQNPTAGGGAATIDEDVIVSATAFSDSNAEGEILGTALFSFRYSKPE